MENDIILVNERKRPLAVMNLSKYADLTAQLRKQDSMEKLY